ncbi:MAG: MerR family transcriptional regulator [Enterococcus sp.]
MKKTYLISEVAEMFDLPVSTLRYYDKQNLLPFVQKDRNGYRVFTESDLAFLKTITCLKNTGMPIKAIQKYIALCMQGVPSIEERKELLSKHAEQIKQQQAQLSRDLIEVEQKIADYTDEKAQAIIEEKIAFVKKEKANSQLANPFD